MPEPLADRLCELTVERILGEGSTDDVTVLAAQWLPAAAPPLQAEAPVVMDEMLWGRDRLTAELDDHGGLRLVVSDDGRWREAGGGGGRGLPLVR